MIHQVAIQQHGYILYTQAYIQIPVKGKDKSRQKIIREEWILGERIDDKRTVSCRKQECTVAAYEHITKDWHEKPLDFQQVSLLGGSNKKLFPGKLIHGCPVVFKNENGIFMTHQLEYFLGNSLISLDKGKGYKIVTYEDEFCLTPEIDSIRIAEPWPGSKKNRKVIILGRIDPLKICRDPIGSELVHEMAILVRDVDSGKTMRTTQICSIIPL